jgi:hypothetical protein
MDTTRRDFLTGAAAVVAAAVVPLPALPAPDGDLDWWGECELRAILDALSGLKDGRFDAVTEVG